LPCILLALCFHETAHGFVAYKCGDPTAYNLGRLTLNPLKHLDPLGFLCMLIFGFGWARPVPINSRYFRHPRLDIVLTALAGPLTNFILGFLGSVLFGLFNVLLLKYDNTVMLALFYLFLVFTQLNFLLCFFNLIPIPPFDGSRILSGILPVNLYMRLIRYERVIMFVVLIALLASYYIFGFSPFSWLASTLTYDFGELFSKLFANWLL
ncbi:MAG: site-2 protease family protein, partial [Clostridia bacterium]|nr:site-2 protease family protein [Clostridia bacterium]